MCVYSKEYLKEKKWAAQRHSQAYKTNNTDTYFSAVWDCSAFAWTSLILLRKAVSALEKPEQSHGKVHNEKNKAQKHKSTGNTKQSNRTNRNPSIKQNNRGSRDRTGYVLVILTVHVYFGHRAR